MLTDLASIESAIVIGSFRLQKVLPSKMSQCNKFLEGSGSARLNGFDGVRLIPSHLVLV